MIKKTSNIRQSVATLTLGALVLGSVPGACLAGNDPLQDGPWRDNRFDMIPVQMATGSSTAAWEPHDTITGQTLDLVTRDIPPGIFALD